MKSNLLFPVALAALAAGTGIFTLARQAEAEERQTAPGNVRHFRFELKNDGSPLRFVEDGLQIQRGESGDGNADPLGEYLRRMLEGNRGNQRGQTNPLEELRKQFGQLRGQADDADDKDNDAPQDRKGAKPQELLEEMMRRMGAGPGGRSGFSGGAEKDPPRTSKYHLSALAEWRPLIAQARQSTVRVMRKDRQIALATIVSADGYALTKASEVAKGKIECEFSDGRIVEAKVVDELSAYDLALIKLEANGLTPAKFADTDTPVGTLIAAVSTGEDPTGLGIISVAARSLDERSKGFLGVMMSVVDLPPKGVRIKETLDGGAAKRAGIESGDIILSVDGKEIATPRQLQAIVASLKPEQKVTLTIERDHKHKSLELSMGQRRAEDMLSRQLDQTALMGSSLSKNATGYPNAVQTDLGLQAEDAGGPVINVDGAIVGLNIARAERVSTYLIPGKAINELLADVQAGKFALSKDTDTLHAELREYNTSLEKAQKEVKEAESRLGAIREALEKKSQKK